MEYEWMRSKAALKNNAIKNSVTDLQEKSGNEQYVVAGWCDGSSTGLLWSPRFLVGHKFFFMLFPKMLVQRPGAAGLLSLWECQEIQLVEMFYY